ncbi:MAG: DUF4112 domain-containing protein [Halofilum sp. (in: g-proteobacteria)]
MANDGPTDGQYRGPHAESLERARRMAHLLDSAFRVPGTSWRIGLDPILGLVPGLGDVATVVPALWILEVARRVGVPRRTRLRMLANLGIDMTVGAVPLLGDLADARYRANLRNIALIDRHLARQAAREGR